MRTLDRYLALTFLRAFIPAWISLVALFFMQAMIAELLEQPYPSAQIIWRGILGLPSMFLQMAPPAVLAGTVLTLAGFSRTGELTAFFSLGFGKTRVLATLAATVFVICCGLLIFQDRISPLFVKKRSSYYWHVMQKRPDFFLDLKKDKIWYRSKNLIFNLKSFDSASRTIFGISVYTMNESFRLVQVIEAKKGVFEGRGLLLQDGMVTTFSAESVFPLTQKFEKKELFIQETPKDFQEIEKEVDGLRLREVHGYIKRMAAAGANTLALEVKFHSRIAICFVPLVMCFLGVPFAMSNRRSGGFARDVGLALVFTFFYWLLYSVSLSLGKNGALHPVLAAWLPSGVFMGVVAFLMARKNQ